MTWVYFAKHQFLARIKIGFSSCPLRRARHLNASLLGCIPGDRGKERATHCRFQQFHISHEWFQDCPPIHSYISAIGASSNIRFLKWPTPAIAIYADREMLRLIESEAAARHPGSKTKPLGPTVMAILVEYFKRKKQL